MRSKTSHRWFAKIGALVLVGSWPTMGQRAEQEKTVPDRPVIATVAAPYSAARYTSRNRRDPFLNPLLLMSKEDLNEEVPRGQPPPGIAGMYIAQVKLLGTSTSEQGQMAVFRGTDDRAYFLREGDRLFDGFVKSIAIDSVSLIRETHLKSGKVKTLEVTKHLRQP